jgi:hypothetical protein
VAEMNVGCNTHVHGSNAMLGISLYSYLKIAKKHLCLSYYLLCFPFNKIGEQEGRTGLGSGEEVAQKMYTHVSKCKNNKIKKENTHRQKKMDQ